jgi:hypothetical protein
MEVGSQLHTSGALSPERTLVPLEEAGLALGLVWMGFGEVKILRRYWGWNPGSSIL